MSNGDKLGPKDQEPTMSEDQITDAVRGRFNGEGRSLVNMDKYHKLEREFGNVSAERSHDNLNGEHFEEFGPEMTKATEEQKGYTQAALHWIKKAFEAGYQAGYSEAGPFNMYDSFEQFKKDQSA